MTTIAEFRASRKNVFKSQGHDVFDDAGIEDCEEALIYGYGVYDYAWGYIEKITVYSMVNNKPYPMTLCQLTLCNEQWVSTDLPSLERKLYEWMDDNGSFEPSPSEMRQRLLRISRRAMDDFWHGVAELYPECKTGDLGPSAVQEFEQAAYKVITTWRDNNGGGQKV